MTRPKPDLYSPANAARFKDAGVVSAYAFRPPYAQEAIEFLAGKALDSPHRVLDVGCGPGDIARRLAPRVASIDAVDFSVGMVEVGRRLPGGDAPNLHWIVSSVESAALEPAYALITAGESLHWFDWDLVMPRFARLLSPNGVIAIVSRDWEGPPAVRERIRPLLMRHSTVRVWQQVSLISELQDRGLFEVLGSRQFAPAVWQPTVDEYLECRHSQQSFARSALGAHGVAAFDADFRETLATLCVEGALEYVNDRLQVPVQTSIVWGVPLSNPP